MPNMKPCKTPKFYIRRRFKFLLPTLAISACVAYYFITLLDPVHYQFRSESIYVPCSLPSTDPFDPSIKQFFWKPKPLVCEFAPPIVFVDYSNTLTLNRTSMGWYGIKDESEIYCKVAELVRRTDDYVVDFNESETILKLPKRLTADFSHVICLTKKNTILFDNVVHGITPKIINNKVDKDRKETVTKPSVLLFGMDSISRSASIRYLPKTRQYLESLGAYDFKGYMKLGDNTIPNFIPLTTGNRLDDEESPNFDKIRFDGYPFLWKNFSEKNYVTMFAEDLPHLSCFNNGMKGFYSQPTDHYMRPFWLALNQKDVAQYKLSNIYRFLEDKGIKVKKSSVFCNQNTPNHAELINYLRQFFQYYRGQRKFSISFLTELAHTFINFLNYGDEPFFEFFKWLKTEGYFNSTILIMFSDHGSRFEDLRNTYIGRIESRMPVLSILIPEQLKKQFPNIDKSLTENTERLVTAYDIHQTLIDVVNGNFDKPSKQIVKGRERGISLFQTIRKDRSCHDAWVPEEFCACYKSEQINVEQDQVIRKIGEAIVERLNHVLSEQKQCRKLSLSKMLSAEKLSLGLKHVGTVHNIISKYWSQEPETNRHRYTVTIETAPGGAVFDASCEFMTGSDLQIIGTIDRTNKYGNQSYCVDNEVLKKYCYCVNL